MTTFTKLTSSDSKSIRSELVGLGVPAKVQVKNGTVYIYKLGDVNASFTADEKAALRDFLVLGGYVNCAGESFTNPRSQIYSGLPVKLLA
jgi:hypothetical protein